MKNGNQSGFTLIEVVAAITLLGLALTMLLGAINQGLTVQHDAEDTGMALWLCNDKLAEIAQGMEGVSSGRFRPPWERFSWESESVPVKNASELQQCTVTVFWQGAMTRREVKLTAVVRR